MDHAMTVIFAIFDLLLAGTLLWLAWQLLRSTDIFRAIKRGALLENIEFFPGTKDVDFTNVSKTENTRVSYPIYHIDNIAEPSIGKNPKNIFFLTCDAYGVLPPISRLTPG